jgi:hypothetical protein
MKFAVLISDNRGLDANKETCQYNSCTAYINAAYCIAHGYDFYYVQPYLDTIDETNLYVCVDPNTHEKRHASWAKLLSTLLLMTKSSKVYDYVVCIDSDCVFKNFHTRLETIVDKHPDADMIVANNGPYHPHLPCCGFFICKNTEWTQAFVKAWYCYKAPASDSAEWKEVHTKACMVYPTPLFPVGTYWEQDSMWLLLQDPDIASHIQLMNEQMMFDEDKDQYLLHVSHERDKSRKAYFMGYVEHLEGLTKQSFQTVLSHIPRVKFCTSSLLGILLS